MKKTFAILSIFISIHSISKAQVDHKAIGARLGGNGNINGIEFSYQHPVGDMNRVELDVGFRGNKYYQYMQVTGMYHWVWTIDRGLNWYVGPGAAIGFWAHQDKFGYKENGSYVGAGGQIGLEYDFNEIGTPILLSIDARPMFDFIGYDTGFGWGAALGVRYTF